MTPKFDIDLYDEAESHEEPIQLPTHFLSIGEAGHDDVKVYIKESVFNELEEYASSDTSKELGTILLGRCTDLYGKLHVVISHYIVANYTDATASMLTFTHDTWADVHQQHDNLYPELKIIGWQHTHPGYGIFLSNYDLFIQENFFDLPFQVAYVIDPVQHLRGFFQWKNEKIEKLPGFYVYNDEGTPIDICGNVEPAEDAEPRSDKGKQRRRGGLLTMGVMILFAVLILVLGVTVIRQNKALQKLGVTHRGLVAKMQKLDDRLASLEEDRQQMVNSDGQGEESWGGRTRDPQHKEGAIHEGTPVLFVSYTVEPGDDLISICKRHGIRYEKNAALIKRMNQLRDLDHIEAGDVLLLPASRIS